MADKKLTQLAEQIDQNLTSCSYTVADMDALALIDTSLSRTVIGTLVDVLLDPNGNRAIYELTNTGWERHETDFIDFNTNKSPLTHKTGRMHWNADEETYEIGINDDGVILQVGRELLLKCCNNAGVKILNGQAVYISGVSGGCPQIELANARNYDKSRALGIATQDISIGGYGEITKFGAVRGLNTGTLEVGTVYLSDEVDGTLTNEQPSDGAFSIEVGTLLVASATEGLLFVDINKTNLTVEVTDTNGFPPSVKENLTLAFDETTKTFSITPTDGSFYFYQYGLKYEKTTAESFVISSVEGLHAIYYDNGVLAEAVNLTDGDIENLIRNACLISYVYWDADNQDKNYFADEMHGISMSPVTHLYNHFTRGAQFLYGYGLADFNVNGDGDIDSSAQFNVSLGAMADEDNFINSPSIATETGLPIYYLDGADAKLRRMINSGFSVTTAGTGRLAFNEWTGTAWQISEVAERDFALYHILAINGVDGSDKVISVMGQNQYTSASNARAGAELEISSLLYLLPIQEIVPIGTVIFETRNAYDNLVKSRIIDTENNTNYVDWRTTELASGAAPSDHANLSGLLTTSQDGTYRHVSDSEPFYLPTFTTTERDVFTPVNGMMIYNSTTNTMQVVQNGVWV